MIDNILKNNNLVWYKNRIDFIEKFIKWKKVLNLWCVDHSYDDSKNTNFFHGDILNNSWECLWLDYEKDEVIKMQNDWFDVDYCDVTSKNDIQNIISKYWKFDVIVAWEIIEHLYNPGLFTDNCKDLLNDNGLLIITTPNPFWFNFFLQTMFYWFPKWVNNDHKTWFDPYLLSILLWNKWSYIDFSWYYDNNYLYNSKKIRSYIFYYLYRFVSKIRKYFNEWYILVIKKNNV